LQSRYYDANVGRFINADSYISTGQGVTGNNMFAYCLNNPIMFMDYAGTRPIASNLIEDENTKDRNSSFAYMYNYDKKRFLAKFTEINEEGFKVHLKDAEPLWDNYAKSVDVQTLYDELSAYLCDEYYNNYGKEFLFSNECVSYEIEYHMDAYMHVNGYSGYYRNVTTLIFSKKYLIEHCKIIDISVRDVSNFKQRTMFNYKKGIRECIKTQMLIRFINL